MPKRPSEIFIGPHTFSITYNAQIIQDLSRISDEDNVGLTRKDKLEIYVADNRPLSAMQETTLHEILHAIIWSSGIDVPEDERAEGWEREEKLIRQLSPAFLDVMQRNPDVFAWLYAEEEAE